jgi:hypothetical protein
MIIEKTAHPLFSLLYAPVANIFYLHVILVWVLLDLGI